MVPTWTGCVDVSVWTKRGSGPSAPSASASATNQAPGTSSVGRGSAASYQASAMRPAAPATTAGKMAPRPSGLTARGADHVAPASPDTDRNTRGTAAALAATPGTSS